jgi:phosphoglycolate phosphatase
LTIKMRRDQTEFPTDLAIAVVTFDLDGTLVDTAGEIAEAVNRTLVDFHHATVAQPQIEALIGAGAHELMRRLLLRIDPGNNLDRAAVFARFDEHYGETAGTVGTVYPGAVACLEALLGAGVRLACVTNKEARYATRVLAATGLERQFELVIGGDTLAWKKPDARVLQHVLTAFDCEPRHAAHVGDSSTDLLSARNAGVADWAVPWGYNAGKPVADDSPRRLFHSLPAIADFVLERRRLDNASRSNSALG